MAKGLCGRRWPINSLCTDGGGRGAGVLLWCFSPLLHRRTSAAEVLAGCMTALGSHSSRILPHLSLIPLRTSRPLHGGAALFPLARAWTLSARLPSVRNRPASLMRDSCSTPADGYSLFCWDQRMQYSYSLLLPQTCIALLCPPRLRLPLCVFRPSLHRTRIKRRTAGCAAKRLIMLKQSPTVFLTSHCSMAGFEMKNRYGGKPNGLTSADSQGPEVKCLQVKIDWSISQIGRCSEVAPSSLQCAFVAV